MKNLQELIRPNIASLAPYKGKGIRYKGEFVRRKEGKKAAK